MCGRTAVVAYAAYAGRSNAGSTSERPLVPWNPKPAGWYPWTLRPAIAVDEPAIRALVRAERMNPSGLTWPTFMVACSGQMLIGAAQICRHRDGSREFGSLVVAPDLRGRGIGTSLIRTLLAHEHDRLHVITGGDGVPVYERHGFRLVPGGAVPGAVRRNLRIGQATGLLARLRGRRPLILRVLERPEQPAPAAFAAE